MMNRMSLTLTLFFLPSIALAILQPGTPPAVTAANAPVFRLSGFCNPGGGDVNITFGTLAFTAPCNGVTGTYNHTDDVSAETTTNPLLHCVSQPPSSTVCSRPVDNGLAPPGGSFDSSPLIAINSENVTSYSVSGLCAPSGASLSLDFGAATGVLTGSCLSNNTFSLAGDVSAVADGVSIPVSLGITSGATTTISNTVDKNTVAAAPFPTVASVSSAFSDADLDTWLETGDSATISIQFSESVNATSGVELDVALASGPKSLSLLSGSGTDTLNFSLPIVANDEQCNGLITIRGVDLNGGSILSVATGEQASFALLDSDVQVEKIDTILPTYTGSISIDDSVASLDSSPIFSNLNLRGVDNCVLTNAQAAIGTSVGGAEATPFTALPSSAFTSYQMQDGVDGYSVSLLASTPYFINLRATDEAGGVATLSSAAWQLSPIFTIPNLIVYLDASDAPSVLDSAGENSDSGAFNGFVESFLDTSASPVVHDFTAFSASQRPAFDGVADSVDFDFSNDCMETPNHPEINTATVTQRSFSTVVTMGANTTTRQMIFEEGGSTRGMNLYVDGGNVYCGFWNARNDGDGLQNFVSQSASVTSGQTYNITSVFDYTNYAGPAGPNGTFTCYINGAAMGAAIPITSRLFAHSGDVSLGCSGDSTRTHTGTSSSRFYSSVGIREFMMFNSPPNATDALDLHNFLQSKWGY